MRRADETSTGSVDGDDVEADVECVVVARAASPIEASTSTNGNNNSNVDNETRPLTKSADDDDNTDDKPPSHSLPPPSESLHPHPPRTCGACCKCPLTRGFVGRSFWLCGHRKKPFGAAKRASFTDEHEARADLFTPCCLVGPNWCCFFATQAIIVIPSVLFFFFVGPLVFPALTAGGGALCAVVLALHYAVGCSNPGILLKQTYEQYQATAGELSSEERAQLKLSLCRYCNVLRPPKTRHCAECDVCIMDLDHHCPYMSKCVGRNNAGAFKAFNVFVMIYVVYVIAVTLLHYTTDLISHCKWEPWSWCNVNASMT